VTPPREPIETRRRQLIEAGLQVLEEDGLAKVSTRSVASRARVPLSTVHYCFMGKDELLQQMLESALARDQALVLRQAASGRDFRETLRLGLEALVDDAVAHPQRTVAHTELSVYALRNPKSVDLVRAQYATLQAAAATLLDLAIGKSTQRQRTRVVGLPDLVACAMDGIMMRVCVVGDRGSAAEAVHALVDALDLLTSATAQAETSSPL